MTNCRYCIRALAFSPYCAHHCFVGAWSEPCSLLRNSAWPALDALPVLHVPVPSWTTVYVHTIQYQESHTHFVQCSQRVMHVSSASSCAASACRSSRNGKRLGSLLPGAGSADCRYTACAATETTGSWGPLSGPGAFRLQPLCSSAFQGLCDCFHVHLAGAAGVCCLLSQLETLKCCVPFC